MAAERDLAHWGVGFARVWLPCTRASARGAVEAPSLHHHDRWCFVTNDAPLPFAGSVTVTSVSVVNASEAPLLAAALDLPAGAGVKQWFYVDVAAVPKDTVLIGVLRDASGQTVSHNVIPLQAPGDMTLPPADVKFVVADSPAPDGTYMISVTTDRPALWVMLTTLAAGRFSDNAFFVTTNATVTFIPFAAEQGDLLKKTLRVEHAAMHLQ